MPIRPELRKYYGREWREVVRPRILARAGNKCERCGKPHMAIIFVIRDGSGRWAVYKTGVPTDHVHELLEWRDQRGALIGKVGSAEPIQMMLVKVGIAHLNHDPTDNSDDNLAALCQACHLRYDSGHHKDTRCERKDQARPLLKEASICA